MSDAFTLGNGRYRLIMPLGEGGMGTVWRAVDGMLGAERAIKILAPEMAAKAKIRQRFDNEARAMARLSHPNVVQIVDVGVDDGRPYMVMEVIDGGSAEDWCQRHGPMSPRLVCDVAIAVLNALEAAHAEGVVHRDVKPANVLLTSYGTVKLTDFGIAHVDDAALTRTGTVMGTWAFMAPEQKADAKSVDARSDVFAVGATIVALLTGEAPADLLAPESTAQLAATLPPTLAEIIRVATRLRPEDRYATAADMRAALRAVHADLPTDPAAPSLGQKLLAPLPVIPVATFDAPVPAAGAPAPEFPPGWGDNRTTVPSEPPPQPRSAHRPPAGPSIAAPPALPPPVQWPPPPGADEPPSWLTGDAKPAPPPPSFPPPAPEEAPRSGPPYLLLGMVAIVGMTATAALLAIATLYGPAPEPVAAPQFLAEPLHPELQPGYVPPPDAPTDAPAATPKPKGTLTLSSIPHADVAIDGRGFGDTRAFEKALAVGTHSVHLTSFNTGKEAHLSVEIVADAPTALCWSFEHDSYCTDAEVKTAMTSK